jgi:uncharacterized glyoxalase superfamily protein PhnB
MKTPPPGWPRLSAGVFYDEPAKAIDWLCRAFGFEVRLKVERDDGSIVHSELVFGEGLIMVGGTGRSDPEKEAWQGKYVSPRSIEGQNTQSICIFVDDPDAHCARARAEGATVIREPRTDDYGGDYWSDRTYGALDLEGHLWWFMQRLRNPKSDAR